MTASKNSESFKFYLKKRGIDFEDYRQECALIELQNPKWDSKKIHKQAMRQSMRAISGNRRKQVDSYALEDKRESLPAVAERHRALDKIWASLPNICKAPLAIALENPTEKLPGIIKSIIQDTIWDCIIKFGLDEDTDADEKIIWRLFSREANCHRIPNRRKVKFMTRSEVQSDLAGRPILTSRDYYDSISFQR